MKKMLFLIGIFFFTSAALAQNIFVVPERTADQQYQRVVWIFHYNQQVAISYAKSIGQSVDEFAKYCGNLYKLTWPKDAGFKMFVEGNLFNFKDLSANFEIIEQTDKKVTAKLRGFNDVLQKNTSLDGVTYEEYIRFFEISHQQIAEYLGCKFAFKIVKDGVEVILETK